MTNTFIPRASVTEELHFRFYYYEPSLATAITFTCFFGLATLLHTYQMVRSKTWFLIPFIAGGILETGGYIARILSALENPGPYDKMPYIIQSLLLLVAPPLFAASIYMELGRIVLMINGEEKLFIRRTWLTKVFVVGDVACFFVQATGSSMLASSDADKIKAGKYIVIGGLFLQVAFFGLFVVAATMFHWRMAKAPTSLARERPWTKHMVGLYIVSVLILLRSLVRCLEFIEGYDGYIMTHEAFLYGFDATPMLLAVLTMNFIHPAEVAMYVRKTKSGGKGGIYVELDRQNAIV